MIVLDTSVLVDAIGGTRRWGPALRRELAAGTALGLPSIVLYEWRRGPRIAAELELQREFFPPSAILPFGGIEAEVAADLYRRLPRARGRSADLAIAACALTRNALLWTANRADFEDVAELRLHEPAP